MGICLAMETWCSVIQIDVVFVACRILLVHLTCVPSCGQSAQNFRYFKNSYEITYQNDKKYSLLHDLD